MGLTEEFIDQNPDLLSKLTQASGPKVELELGPLNKNIYTYAYETIVSAFLKSQVDKDSPPVVFEVRGEVLYATYEGQEFNMSEILKYTNLNHVSLSEHDAKAYEQFVTSDSSSEKPSLDGVDGIPTSEDYAAKEKASTKPDALTNLNWAEKSAINIYTGGFYSVMNPLLRGSTSQIYSYDSTKIGETLAHIAFIGSGLNCISEEKPMHTYRVEEKFSEEYIQERVDAVEKGGLVTQEMAFISSSHAPNIPDEETREMYKEGMESGSITGIVYSNVVGKYVSSISKKPDEMEYLIPRTQMQWVGHHQNNNGGHVFHAKPVATPTGLSEKHQQSLNHEEAQKTPSVTIKQRLLALKSDAVTAVEDHKDTPTTGLSS
jgi:hypothetical protein